MVGDFNNDFNDDFLIEQAMTKDEILALIVSKIEGQGNQIDAGSTLPAILRGIIGLIPAAPEPVAALMIQSANNTTVGGYQVPALSADQVTQAYNAVVTGRGCIIVDYDETMHAYVNQADALNDELSIGILFYSSMLLTYTLSGDSVTITHTEI